ncbi:MAG: hypothetical protein HKO66_07420, partial [Saprospiraceae bacterium]|nr:hypothetical protein [Bacteroidia bacterium]NNL92043.1 hypothetical protein [Saprospiraceae bacterium]
MKNKNLVNHLLVFLAILSLSFNSCLKDDCSEERFFLEYEPIYVQPEDFRVPVTTESPREMETTGKIYFFNDMIFINELYKG